MTKLQFCYIINTMVTEAKLPIAAAKLRMLLRTDPRFGGRIPSFPTLATVLGVSPLTVHRVVKQLVTGGELVKFPWSNGIFNPASGIPDAPGTRGRKAVEAALRDDIVNAVFPFGESALTLKDLAVRYRSSYRTVKKATEKLQLEGLLERHGNRLLVLPAAATRVRLGRTVVAVHQSVIGSLGNSLTRLLLGVQRELEACAWDPMKLVIVNEPLEHLSSVPYTVSGIILATSKICPSGSRWNRFACRFRDTPLVLADLAGDFVEDAGIPGNPFLVTSYSYRAGVRVGAYLRAKGIKRAGWFDWNVEGRPPYDWMVGRLDGLRSVFGCAHPDQSLRAFRAELPPTDEQPPDELRLSELPRKIRGISMVPRQLLAAAAGRLYSVQSLIHKAPRMRMVFEEAYSNPDIRAWVCCNDAMAAVAFQFLSERAGTGHQPLLVGFDDSDTAQRLGFPSFDFPADKMGHVAVRYLVRPQSVAMERNRVLHIDGTVVEH